MISIPLGRSKDTDTDLINSSQLFYLVDGGHRAVIFDRFRGVIPDVSGEGTHFLIPWVQKPIIFDVRSRPRNVAVITGSKGNNNSYILGYRQFQKIPNQSICMYKRLCQI